MKVEFTKQVVVLGQGSFSFEDLDGDSLLVVLIGGKDLRFLGWNFMVSGNDLGHDSSDGLNTQGKRHNVKQDKVGLERLVSTQDCSLNSSSIGNGFIGIDKGVGLFAVKKFLKEFSYQGNSG